MVKKTKSNRPLDNPFTQQKLPAWQPILSVHWVVLSFIVLFAIFTPIGIGLIFASKSVTEISSEYTNECTLPDFNSTYTHRQCKIEVCMKQFLTYISIIILKCLIFIFYLYSYIIFII